MTNIQMRTKPRKPNPINFIAVMQLCVMRKQLDKIKIEVTQRIYKEFQVKFDGNNRQFAKAAGCNEKTIRMLFDNHQGMTLNLFFKLAAALDKTPSELLNGLKIDKED